MVKRVVERAWKLKGNFMLTIHGESAFIFYFVDDEDRSTALEHGYLYISNQLFLVQPWHPDIESEIAELKSVPIWINLRKVPLHFWDSDGLSSIASYLGRPVRMDNQTLNRSRISYARVCVEVDVMFDYQASIPVVVDDSKRFNVYVEYSWKPPKCMHCHVFGHNRNGCSKLKMEKAAAVIAAIDKKKQQVKEVYPNIEDEVEVTDITDSYSISNMNDDENHVPIENLEKNVSLQTSNMFEGLQIRSTDPKKVSRVKKPHIPSLKDV
ncbi:uncharacterized protein LOC113324246 [Papaver somniferum]|uniref:uncharacterized protein LOC113324246 n=1 Tax=Papaver somniferum TaxID=3469 RepID=UPI000E702F45|nr:uncharacterized protein LOC113324246 [Papaver somniferum]